MNDYNKFNSRRRTIRIASEVAQTPTIRTIIVIASAMGWKLHQMHVKTAFLNDIIQEKVYLEPEGFVVH